MQDAPLYVFDAHCILCSRSVGYILKYEKTPNTRFIAILSSQGQALAQAHDIDPENPDSFLFISGDRAYQSSDAVLELLRRIGGPARFLLIGRIVPKAIRDFLYRRIAKNRYRLFGRTDICYVPSAETRHRFILS